MTAEFALHLIEQFAAQAPLAIWITDSRGVTIFANKKLHELLSIPDHPSGALGLKIFDDPAMKALQLEDAAKRARTGEVVEVIVQIPAPDRLESRVPIGRTAPVTLKALCFPLRSSAQQIEHFVFFLKDVTEAHAQREKLRQHLRDLTIFNKSKGVRQDKLDELRREEASLQAEIKKLGATPVV